MTTVNSAEAAKSWGVFGWNYNRANFKLDQGLRWQRYICGRKMACAQVAMFRQDVSDLAGVSMAKLKVYGPIYGIVIGVCVTVFVEGRSGLKYPGPPVFISGVYLQCLTIGMSFMSLATWLLFHATMRAQIACIQLRTRIVRIPAPTQKQLDGSRKLLSTWEEQGLYDMFRIPFVMPNGAASREASDEEDEADGIGKKSKCSKTYQKGGLTKVAARVTSKAMEAGVNARMPGFTPGHPTWYENELTEHRDAPENSPSAYGQTGPQEPYEHFELLRAAQKEWWGAEAYMRVCFLYGMMHLIMAFSYWITLHNIAELGLIWCSNLGAAGLTAGVWIMFRMDVIPDHGGWLPWEIGGPFVTSVSLTLMYAHHATQTMIDVARAVAAGIIIMHIFLTFRLYAVAKPTGGKAHHMAKEAGGRHFNESGSCSAPLWLPTAFQHVMYLVAPPKSEAQEEEEAKGFDNSAIRADAMAKVDMTPWTYVRVMLFVVGLGWLLQLSGHIVECVMGERMLVSNPGMPPWTRAGQWYGWEHGPVSSKHYAHVTPQRGHWAWQKGWGPQGQQELWPSDMFGFAPEADGWWAEEEGPEPRIGAAAIGKNTWAQGVIAYGQNEPKWGAPHVEDHDWMNSGGHRRLQEDYARAAAPRLVGRPLVPVPVNWPKSFEPDHVACGPLNATCVVVSSSGQGALVGSVSQDASMAFVLEGLLELGMARSLTWGPDGLLLVTGSGRIAKCPHPVDGSSVCYPLQAALLPIGALAVVLEADPTGMIRVAIVRDGSVLLAEHLKGRWKERAALKIPGRGADEEEIVSVAGSSAHVLVTTVSGEAFKWELRGSRPAARFPMRDAPLAPTTRSWRSSCVHPSGRIMRLANSWKRSRAGAPTLVSEMLL